MLSNKEQILEFINSHARSLRYLWLDNVALVDKLDSHDEFVGGSWVMFLSQLRPWHEMSILQLEEFHIHHSAGYKNKVFRSSEAIKAFLRGQGQNPFNKKL